MLEASIGKNGTSMISRCSQVTRSRRWDVSEADRAGEFPPRTSLREGSGRFVDWYKEYYKLTVE
jgi:UDP-glucuronate 4-epimerase